jgi:hypothetical protein
VAEAVLFVPRLLLLRYWGRRATVKRKTRHTFLEKETGAILDSYSIMDEENQLLPQVGETIERHGEPWTVAAILPVTPALDDPDHPEAAVEIVCEPAKAKTSDGEPAPDPGA